MLQETVYEYDPNGNLEVVFDSKGQKIKYEYDLVNRITKVLYYAAGDHTKPVKTRRVSEEIRTRLIECTGIR